MMGIPFLVTHGAQWAIQQSIPNGLVSQLAAPPSAPDPLITAEGFLQDSTPTMSAQKSGTAAPTKKQDAYNIEHHFNALLIFCFSFVLY